MLIASHRHTAADIEHWRSMEALDLRLGPAAERRAAAAIREIEGFASAGPCYAGVSWGKDSVVLAHLVARAGLPVPLVWVRVEPICNPDCAIVRDAFLAAHEGIEYMELEVWCRRDAEGWHATGTLEEGFARAAVRYGPRYVSGIRGEESAGRARRVRSHGLSTGRTCAPIGRWSSVEVFAYLAHHELPVHPAYACTHGGSLDRGRLRVASLGGQRGTGRGRAEWEDRYYREEVARIEAR